MFAPGIPHVVPDPLIQFPLRIEAGWNGFLVKDAGGDIIATTIGTSGFAYERIVALCSMAAGAAPADAVMDGQAPSPEPGPFAPGDIVAWRMDPRPVSARNLYVVTGPAPDSEAGSPQRRIQALRPDDIGSQWAVNTLGPVEAEVDRLIPLASFAMRIAQIAAIVGEDGRHTTALTLRFDPTMPVLVEERLRGRFHHWWERTTEIDDAELAELVRSRMLSRRSELVEAA